MPRLFVEAPLNPGASVADAAQYLMAELDRVAAGTNRVISGPVSIGEGHTAFERIIRVEADTQPR